MPTDNPLSPIIRPIITKIRKTFFGYLRSARWYVKVNIAKNFGVTATHSFWVNSQWPASGNSLLIDVLDSPTIQRQLEVSEIKELSEISRAYIQIEAMSNQRGPVGYSHAFNTDTRSEGFYYQVGNGAVDAEQKGE